MTAESPLALNVPSRQSVFNWLRQPCVQGGLLVTGLTLACLGWAYWLTLCAMAERWSTEAQYSHGFLVPVFALIILWFRRDRMPAALPAPNWWGVAWLAGGGLLRFLAAYLYLDSLDALSLLPTLVGVCLLLGGWPSLRWSWPAIAFLGFMLPLPYQVETALAQPLRRLATECSTFALQTLGFAAVAEGNIIVIDEFRLGVIDACNGLGMLMTFFALATAMALVIDRPLLDRLVLVVSAIPIAVIVNVLRITLTGAAHIWFGREIGHALMHDLAGWIMMPAALVLLWLELVFLKNLLLEEVPPAGASPSREREVKGGSGPVPPCEPVLQPLLPKLPK